MTFVFFTMVFLIVMTVSGGFWLQVVWSRWISSDLFDAYLSPKGAARSSLFLVLCLVAVW